jgi:spermidine synthase
MGELEAQTCVAPFVRNDAGGRSLHFSLDELQSRMDPRKPWQLEIDYTRTMMGFLLLHASPLRIGMVGLGGGSLAKFCHRHLPQSQLTVVEINPHVIALRDDFGIPPDDARLHIVQADGAAFVAAHADSFDVLLVDGFDHAGQPEQLCTQGFYDDCQAALAPGGVLVVNLHHDDAAYPLRAARIHRSFAGNAAEIPAPEQSNCIVFASRGEALSPRRIHLKASLQALDAEARAQLKAEFARIAWSMKETEAG